MGLTGNPFKNHSKTMGLTGNPFKNHGFNWKSIQKSWV